MSTSQQEILFFETIAHDGEIEQVLQVDEIKFDQPVYIDEIRILPAGYNVNALEKSTIRMGATKPIPCELEFFGKNLNARSNRDRARYRRLGKKVFRDENDIAYYPSLSIPTDSLIVKGKYDTLTIAVIGVLARPKSPPTRHDPPSNNRQIVDFLQSAAPPHRPHPMDTLPLKMGPPTNTPPNSFVAPQHSHLSSTMENMSSSSASHADGVWVAPPEQSVRQQTTATTTGNFSNLSSQRSAPVQPRLNDEHLSDYNQHSYAPRIQTRPNYSPSEFLPPADRNLDEIDDKGSRMPTNIQPYRPNLSEHMTDDPSNMMSNPNFSYSSQQNSFSNDPNRRTQETFSTSFNAQQENRNDADSYESDDNTSESETSSVQGLFFTEEEHQTMKREALYNTRGSTRSTTLKTFSSPIKSSFEIECEKFQDDEYRRTNSELVVQFRKFLSNVSIDHCDQTFLETFESMCQVFPTALASLNSNNDELTAAIQRLTDWASKLIQIDYVITKQFTELDATLLKIRIIKCGIRLSGHLSVLTEEISNEWIKSDFQSKLLDLFDDQCVAPSVKLLIVKILDQSLFFKSGIQWFTGQHVDFPSTTHPSPYFRLIEKLQFGTESKKSICSISCLIRKIHLHEEFFSFQYQIKSLSSDESSTLTIEQADNRKKIFDDLLLNLATIRDVLINSVDLISQEKSSRIAPCQTIVPVVFEKVSNYENSWPCILRWMIDNEFLQCLTVLVHLTIVNQRQDLFNVIEEILRGFFNSFDALVFLAHQISISNELLKSLFFAETKFEDSNNDPVGPQLRCVFQTLNCLEELKTSNDENELLQILHRLLSLIFFHHYVGKLSTKRRIIVRVLAMNSNLEILLNLIESNENETKIRTRYVSKILYEVFSTIDSIVLIEKFGKKLFQLCEKRERKTSTIDRLRQMLSPVVKLNDFQFSEETAEILLKEFRTSLEESTQTGDLPSSLMTILRLIQYFSIPPENQFVPGAKIELKYDFMLSKFFSHGVYPLLIDVLNKCADRLLTSWQIGIPLNISDRISTYGILLSALIVFRTILQKLMFDRKTKFVDLTPVKTLHSIYMVTLCASPTTDLTDIELIRTNLIDSLNAFSWSIENEGETISVENCRWTQVLKEILRLSASLPYSITSGLCLLTELLPIPLPLTVRQPLNNNECNAIRDDFQRFHLVLSHIWIHDENQQLSKIVQTFCHTSSSIMQEILRRLSMQLIDLGPKLAKLVMKMLMDELINSCKTNSIETIKTSKFISNDAGRLVAFIATLVAMRSGKCALLSLLNSTEEKYSLMIKDLVEYLHVRAESNETCLCQEATMSIIQTLCDANVSLTSFKSTDNPLQFLANSLPKSDLISQILTNLLRFLSSTKQQTTWTQTTMAIRTLISLAEHDFGLQLIRNSLVENPNVFSSLISEFDLRFDKEQPDYLEAVSTLMIFLERLTTIDESPFARTKVFPLTLFKEFLGVSPNNESQLEKFIELINAVVTDDSTRSNGNIGDVVEPTDEDQCVQTLQKLLERANRIIQLIKSNENPMEIDSNDLLILPKAKSIDIQFENRSIYLVTNEYIDDQRNSELFWLGVPTASLLDDVEFGQDETSTNSDENNEKAKCDLEDLIVKYCGNFHFADEFRKQVIDRIRRKRKSSSKKRSVNVEPTSTNVDTSIITTSASRSRVPWSAPMRGNNRRNLRPNATGVNIHPHNPHNPIGARRADHFRNRPLNTSRPPSMHVDEFEKQFHEGSNNGNSSSSNNNNNNLNENNSGTNNNNNNDNDLMTNLSSSSDNGPERERWPVRRGFTPSMRPGILAHHRYPFLPGHLPYPGGPFGLRERLPYGYPPSRYPPFEMDFHAPYFGPDEPMDDRPYEFYPMTMPFDSIRYRGHFGRYDPGGFH